MAKEARTERGAIARAGKRRLGYDVGQVDAFLERAHALYDSDEASLTQQDIQNVSFDLAKGGYDIAQVDAALSRLEKAVVDRQTAAQIGEHGRVAWRAQTEELYRRVAAHAERAPRTRFADGPRRQPSYDRRQVDALIDGIVAKAAGELGMDAPVAAGGRAAQMTAASVGVCVFTQRKGARGYDERQVDFFLNSCVQLLTRIESFARVADMVQREAAPASDLPADAAATASFDEVHEAERAIFAPTAATDAATTVIAPTVPAMPAAPEPDPVPVRPAAAPFTVASPVASSAVPPVAPSEATLPVASPVASPMPADSSLAQLAQMAEQSQEQASQVAPQTFHPHIPDLPASIAPIVPDLDASSIVSMPSPAPEASTSPMPPMPASYAPERRPERTSPQGRVAQSTPATPPAGGTAPTTPADAVASMPPFPHLNQTVDTDIPDLSFPSLFGDDTRRS